ncbi:germination protein YpeB [Paenibacillus xylaniclasticus]|uniref:germination protein YpeB n=1 Tax=Paenibacillus xylaniclasticus TaxID=588083 RepID=UPI000FDC1922|nr:MULTISPECIES: germination protein YpeB [Paenibacillus]GFN30618.1 germination protein YpeB [Paenibacillus curdlanolyticus]
MYKRLSAVMFPVVTLLCIGSIIWGYQEHQEKNSILIKAENQYQRAFHDLSYHVEQVHKQLGNTLAVNSKSQAYHRKGLINVWRLTSEAQNEVNQLPLTLLPFNTTEEFLSRISNFAYKTAVRDLSKNPLTDEEFKTMKTLYERSDEIAKNLRSVQQKVLQNNLRWMDVEAALASEKTVRDNSIIDGFKTVDNKVGEYPEINWGPSVASMYQKRTVKMLSGKLMTPEEIKRKTAKFLDLKSEEGIRVVENGKGTEYASFTATVERTKGEKIQLDFTQKGGQLIWYMNPRDVGAKQVGLNEARKAADKFLNAHGYQGMKPSSYDEYGNEGVFTYVATQNGVLIYPEKITVKVALDNAQVIAVQASDYVYEHHTRKLKKPRITKAEARQALNPDMKVTSETMALILNDMGEETLCYEFVGRINGHAYKMYINADTGVEETIEETADEQETAQASS